MSEDRASLNVGSRRRLNQPDLKGKTIISAKTTARLTQRVILIYNNISGCQTSHLQIQMLLNYENYFTMLYNGANVCPVSSIAVSFIKQIVPLAQISSLWSTNETHSHQSLPHVISMRFTHFQVTFQRTNVHLFVTFS